MRRIFLCLVLLIMAQAAFGQITAGPTLINFQGRLAKPDGTPVTDGNNYTINFTLYDAVTGGNARWTQTVNSVQVRNGVFAVLLDFSTGFVGQNTIDTAFNGSTWLQIGINGGAALTPRQRIASTAYALKANSVPDNSITSAALVNNAVTNAKIATNAVTNAKIADGSVASSKLADGAVTQSKLGDGSVNNIKLATDAASLLKVSGGAMSSNGTSIGIGTTGPLAPLHIVSPGLLALFLDSSFTAGTWLRMNNASAGGHNWNLISSGSGNTESAGKLLFNDQTNNGGTRMTIDTAGNVGIGTSNPAARLEVNGTARATVVEITGGSDVAEPYSVAPVGKVMPLPGMLVSIDPAHLGRMKVAARAYDRCVGGVISGANGINPGITLRQKGTVADGALPVASIGRVWVRCDASANGAIEPGDLLTTSNTPGHAMRATNANRSNGAVIGKAMSSLKKGKGLVLVLVSLK